MTAMFELLILAAFSVSIIHCENADSQISECRIPDNSSINGSLNVHVNLSEEEFDLLHIEGQCFLFCATREEYRTEIRMRNYSLSRYWPFISVKQSETVSKCSTIFKVHECTRGCLRRHRGKYGYECNKICKNTCHSATELQNCELFECHPWIPLRGCQEMCIPSSHPYHPCNLGCETDNLQQSNSSAPPCDPIGPPLLIQDNKTVGQFKFNVDLSGAAPQLQKCESICNFTDLPPVPPVAFLFKFVNNNSGNISYKWTANPFEHLDLTDYACQELLVSFAVSNMEGLSMFSPEISLIINGDEQLSPIPPNNLIISEEIDEREGFFGHVILNISWDAPQNYSYLDHFMIIIITTAGYNTTLCGCMPWIGRVLPNETLLSVEANLAEKSLPVMSYSYDIQLYSVGCFGVSYPLRVTHDINVKFNAQSISFECQRLWQSKEIQLISFNLTWVLPPYLRSGNVISKFVVELKLTDITKNITIPIHTNSITFPQKSPMIFTRTSNFIAQELNMTFLHTLLSEESSWFYHVVAHVMWNTSNIPSGYIPPKSIYTCAQSTLYPVPGLVEDLNITSCFMSGSDITLHLECLPPSIINGAELDSYDVCIGLSLMPDQEIIDDNNGSDKCLVKELCQTEIDYHHAKSNIDSNTPLYVQIRARTVYTKGNWSVLYYDLSKCHQRIGSSYVGVITGISLSSSLALVCLVLPIGLATWLIQRRKKLYRAVQGLHDPMFSGGIRNFNFQRSLASPQQPDRWEIPSDEIIVKERLGEGAFGEVYRGIIKCPITNPVMMRRSSMKKSIFTPVAIKLLKSSSRGNERQDFLSEIEMMKKVAEGQNPHVVGLLGCVTIREPLCLITEFIKYGDLLSYLRTNRRMCTGSNTEEDDNNDTYLELGNVSPVDLISFAYQITSGMEYLSSLGIVHRDLACRNILVDEGKVLKITDFGLSRETDEIYVQKSTGRVPLKWMAIESIVAREFTSASDIWSFGVVLWEIGTLGGIPYPSIQNDYLLSQLKGGYRMEKPDNCSPEVYDIMLVCWNEQPKERPTFKELRAKFDAMLLAEQNDTYIALCIDESKMYYQNLTPVTTTDKISASCTSLNTNQKDLHRSKDPITDKNPWTQIKVLRSKQSSISLDETHCTERRKENDEEDCMIGLSLQVLTQDQHGQYSENCYVHSPIKGVATSPTL